MSTRRPPRPRLPLFTGQVITREELPSDSELKLHFTVAKLLRTSLPATWRWTHIANGERRDERTGAKLKRMGVAPGWPDIAILSPATSYRRGRLHFVELKRRGGRMSDEQEAFAAWCRANRVEHVVASDIHGVVTALTAWGAFSQGGRP